jgi:hypothetical protein
MFGFRYEQIVLSYSNQTHPEATATSFEVATGGFFLKKKRPERDALTHLHIITWLRVCGGCTSTAPYFFMMWSLTSPRGCLLSQTPKSSIPSAKRFSEELLERKVAVPV